MMVARCLLLLLVLVMAPEARAQWAVQNWVTTRLHDDARVDLPYEAQPASIPNQPQGLKIFEVSTASTDYAVMSLDRRYFRGYRSDRRITPRQLSRFFDHQSRQYGRRVFHGHLLTQANVVFAESPARAVVYLGYDYEQQQPTRIETVWVWRSHALYLFACTYRTAEQQAGADDRRKFFSSVSFDEPEALPEI